MPIGKDETKAQYFRRQECNVDLTQSLFSKEPKTMSNAAKKHADDELRSRATPLSQAIFARRDELGLSRNELAQRMGYTNLNNGCRRIALWERGDEQRYLEQPNGLSEMDVKLAQKEIPNGERLSALSRALETPEQQLSDLLEPTILAIECARQRHRDLRNHGGLAAVRERSLIRENLSLLHDHASSIIEQPHLGSIPLNSCGIVAAFLGGRTFTLKTLLQLHRSNQAVTTCARCGGKFWVLYAAGSPLSGTHSLTGFCEQSTCDQTWQRLATGQSFLRFAVPILECKQGNNRPTTPWTLSQLLCELGVEVADVTVCSDTFEPIATYSHEHQTLCYGSNQKSVGFGLYFGSDPVRNAEESATFETLRGSPREGGQVVLGSISPLSFGAYRGELLTLKTADGESWQYRKGLLYDPSGRIVFVLNGDLPPPVLAALIDAKLEV